MLSMYQSNYIPLYDISVEIASCGCGFATRRSQGIFVDFAIGVDKLMILV